jgi:hypothetical protein
MKKPKEDKKHVADKKKVGITETNIKAYMKKFI